MLRMIRFACPACGKRLKAGAGSAGKIGWCRGCGEPVRVQALFRTAGAASDPWDADRDAGPSADRAKEPTFLICAIMGAVGLVLVVAVAWSLEWKRRSAAEERANQAVAGWVEAAREPMAHRDWDRAVELLERALKTENATRFGDAPALLLQARQGQADTILEAAEAAVERQDSAQALRLLHAYLASPDATKQAGALLLQKEVKLAASDEKAIALLSRLPDEALASLDRGGTPPGIEGVGHPAVRKMYLRRLLRHLPREQQRRVAAARRARTKQLAEARRARQERERRMARIRGTPVFRELTEFVALVEKQHRGRETSADDRELLNAALAELEVTDPRERDKLVQDEGAGQQVQDRMEERISQKRANVKERFRSYQDFDRADRQLFDRAVDEALDRLLVAIRAA